MREVAALVLAGMLALATAGCAGPSASQDVADRFMDLYYARANVAEALTLTTGAAKARLAGELQALAGVKADPASEKPRVSFTLTSSATPSPTQATYVYKVVAHTADVGKVGATLTLTEEGGRWLVAALNEVDGAPSP